MTETHEQQLERVRKLAIRIGDMFLMPQDANALQMVLSERDALLEALKTIKGYFADLENGTRHDDPLKAIRAMAHVKFHAVIDAAIARCDGWETDAVRSTGEEFKVTEEIALRSIEAMLGTLDHSEAVADDALINRVTKGVASVIQQLAKVRSDLTLREVKLDLALPYLTGTQRECVHGEAAELIAKWHVERSEPDAHSQAKAGRKGKT